MFLVGFIIFQYIYSTRKYLIFLFAMIGEFAVSSDPVKVIHTRIIIHQLHCKYILVMHYNILFVYLPI